MTRVPALVFLIHVVCIFVYDIDSPTGKRKWSPVLQAIVLYLVALGIIQPLFAFITATVICPVFAAIVLLCKCFALLLCCHVMEFTTEFYLFTLPIKL